MIAAEYYDLCAAHDWSYNFTDDHNAWKRGEAERLRLIELFTAQPELHNIFIEWQNWYIDRLNFVNAEIPARPNVVTFPGDVPTVHPNQLSLCFDSK